MLLPIHRVISKIICLRISWNPRIIKLACSSLLNRKIFFTNKLLIICSASFKKICREKTTSLSSKIIISWRYRKFTFITRKFRNNNPLAFPMSFFLIPSLSFIKKPWAIGLFLMKIEHAIELLIMFVLPETASPQSPVVYLGSYKNTEQLLLLFLFDVFFNSF